MNRRPEPGSSSPAPAPEGESVAQLIGDWLRGLGRSRSDEPGERESLADVLGEEARSAHDLAPVERLMLLNILRLGDVRIGNVMVPRADIVAVELGATLAELMDVFRDGLHSRIPVYREALDDIAGFVHIKDTIQYWGSEKKFRLTDNVRTLPFVPPSMRVVDLFLQMRQQRVHMAVVVDEFGGTDGLVTIEDLVEEIVGEIEDEHEGAPAPMFTDRPDGSVIADARGPIEDLETRLGMELVPTEREEDIDTVGGLVFSMVGRVPLRGELIPHPAGFEFEVLDSDPRRVRRVRIARTVQNQNPGESDRQTPER
jgi:CBS domain containing-hemolysin-like protein